MANLLSKNNLLSVVYLSCNMYVGDAYIAQEYIITIYS